MCEIPGYFGVSPFFVLTYFIYSAVYIPFIDWLEKVLSPEDGKASPKLVTVVNPGNPSGMCIPETLLHVSSSTE